MASRQTKPESKEATVEPPAEKPKRAKRVKPDATVRAVRVLSVAPHLDGIVIGGKIVSGEVTKEQIEDLGGDINYLLENSFIVDAGIREVVDQVLT